MNISKNFQVKGAKSPLTAVIASLLLLPLFVFAANKTTSIKPRASEPIEVADPIRPSNNSNYCVPRAISPTNQDIVTSAPTITWGTCANAAAYQITVNGGIAPGTIGWTSVPLTSTTFTMSGFTFDPGGAYTWQVRSCADSGCNSTSAWSSRNSFWYQYKSN